MRYNAQQKDKNCQGLTEGYERPYEELKFMRLNRTFKGINI